jgi:hypothetical protein
MAAEVYLVAIAPPVGPARLPPLPLAFSYTKDLLLRILGRFPLAVADACEAGICYT